MKNSIGLLFSILLLITPLKILAQNLNNSAKSTFTLEEIQKINGIPIDSLQREKVYAKQDSMYKDYLEHKANLHKSQSLLMTQNQ